MENEEGVGKYPINYVNNAVFNYVVWFDHSCVVYENLASNISSDIDERPIHGSDLQSLNQCRRVCR